MAPTARHIDIHIDRPREAVHAYVANPANLPAWAHGLGTSVERVGERWIAPDSPMGRVTIAFVPANDLGVLDHDVTLPDGRTFNNPVRVLDDPPGSLLIFTLRIPPDADPADTERDADMVRADLLRLKNLLEGAASPE
jgi:uncharacterized protein YndB with AHSA1/START domain